MFLPVLCPYPTFDGSCRGMDGAVQAGYRQYRAEALVVVYVFLCKKLGDQSKHKRLIHHGARGDGVGL